MKFCENCGFKLSDAAKFCGKCGTQQSVIIKPSTNSVLESPPEQIAKSLHSSAAGSAEPVAPPSEEKNTPAAPSAASVEKFIAPSVADIAPAVAPNAPTAPHSEAEAQPVCNYPKTPTADNSVTAKREEPPQSNEKEYIQCPYCCEKIIKGARICRYCHSNLVGEPKPAITSAQSTGGAVKTAGSFNWSILLCASSLICQAVIIILALTDLLTVGFELSYGGYSFYKSDYSFGLSIFSCFDIGDLISKLQTLTNFTGDGLKTGLTVFGVCLLGLIGAYLIQLIYRLYTLYKNSEWLRQHKKCFGFDGYSVALPVIFVIFVICVYGSLIDTGISDVVNLSLSPSMIAIIVIICTQIVINIIAKKYETEQRGKTANEVTVKLTSVRKEIEDENSNSRQFEATWQCPNCHTVNNMGDNRCSVCGLLLQEVEEQGYWRCLRCGTPNDLELDSCISCKCPRTDCQIMTKKFNFPL